MPPIPLVVVVKGVVGGGKPHKKLSAPTSPSSPSTITMPSTNQYEPPSSDSDLEDDTTLTLKEFWQHQKKVAASDKLAYILMVGRGVHPRVPPLKDLSESVPVFKEALMVKAGGLNKSKLNFTKAMVKQELYRRCPELKDSGFNAKMRTSP